MSTRGTLITPSKTASGGFSDAKFIWGECKLDSETYMKKQLRMFQTMIFEQRDWQLRTFQTGILERYDAQVGGVLHQPREDD